MSTPITGPSGVNQSAAERGVVLIWTSVSLMLIAGLVMSSVDRMRAMDRLAEAEFTSDGQARSVAQAGLTDSIAWLRRSTTQPVTEFNPERDPGAAPPPDQGPPPPSSPGAMAQIKNDTEDPTVGLVRTFQIAPGVWARYSIIRGTPTEDFTDLDGDGLWQSNEPFVDDNEDGLWTPGTWTRDVTRERGLPGAGAVWLLAARGQIFRRTNSTLELGEGPNRQLAQAMLATEVRRLTIALPAEAALLSTDGSGVFLGNRVRVRGSTAVAYTPGTGTPDVSAAELEGGLAPVPDFGVDIGDIFGVTWSELKSMADINTDDPANGLPAELPDYSLTVVTGNVVFDNAHPLGGNGVVVVKGDVTITAGSNSFFQGLLYVDGDLTAQAPIYLRGSVVVTGDTDIRGTGGDYCEIEHDPGVVSKLLARMGQYRQSKAPYKPMPILEDGRPTEMGESARRHGGHKGKGRGKGVKLNPGKGKGP